MSTASRRADLLTMAVSLGRNREDGFVQRLVKGYRLGPRFRVDHVPLDRRISQQDPAFSVSDHVVVITSTEGVVVTYRDQLTVTRNRPEAQGFAIR